jgi:segregation and condensation protein B
MTNELLKAQVEAALFLTEKPLKAQAVAVIVNAEVNLVRQTILELINDYEARNGGLEVADDDGYIIQVKDEYTNLVDEFVPIDMPTALIRTLSAIAIKQPVMQSEVIKIRGAGAYDHIKELVERELIMKREDGGRSPVLTTTKKFQEYFRLSKDGKTFRQQMSGLAKEVNLSAGDAGDANSVSDSTGADAAGDSSNSIVEAANTFDASPDPSTPPIGMAVEGTTDDENLDLNKVILEDTDTEAISKLGETVEQTAATSKPEAEESTGTKSDVNTTDDVIASQTNSATETSTS